MQRDAAAPDPRVVETALELAAGRGQDDLDDGIAVSAREGRHRTQSTAEAPNGLVAGSAPGTRSCAAAPCDGPSFPPRRPMITYSAPMSARIESPPRSVRPEPLVWPCDSEPGVPAGIACRWRRMHYERANHAEDQSGDR